MADGVPKKLIVLMPVYEDRASARKLVEELARCCPVKPFIVVVEDGSLDDAMRGSDIAQAGLDGEVVHLARNLGHQRAIAAGLMHVAASYAADAVIVMDSDGEDPPAAIPKLLEALDEGKADVVVAKRRQRNESWQFRSFYVVYRRLFQLLTGRRIRFGNFMALSGRAARRMAAMQEAWVHFPASVMISRLRYQSIPIDRGARYFGASRMNLVSLILHGMRSIMVFADDVLVRICMFCIALGAVSVALIGIATVLKLIGMATPGWFSTAWGLLIIILLQAGMLSFITLMVSGTIKGASPMQRAELDLLIDRIEPARSAAATVTA